MRVASCKFSMHNKKPGFIPVFYCLCIMRIRNLWFKQGCKIGLYWLVAACMASAQAAPCDTPTFRFAEHDFSFDLKQLQRIHWLDGNGQAVWLVTLDGFEFGMVISSEADAGGREHLYKRLNVSNFRQYIAYLVDARHQDDFTQRLRRVQWAHDAASMSMGTLQNGWWYAVDNSAQHEPGFLNLMRDQDSRIVRLFSEQTDAARINWWLQHLCD